MRFGWLAAAAALVCAGQAEAVNYVTYEVRGVGSETSFMYSSIGAVAKAVDIRFSVTVDTDAGTFTGPAIFNYTSTGSVYTAYSNNGIFGTGNYNLTVNGSQSGILSLVYAGTGQFGDVNFRFDLTYLDTDALGGLPRSFPDSAAAGTVNYSYVNPRGFSTYGDGRVTAITTVQTQPVTSAPMASGVPEPAAWAMMIAGFGLAGGIARRRRKAATA